MKFDKILHVALDELRMQMLGTQVLFGFQLEVAFQERFSQTSGVVHGMAALALGLIVLTLGLLIAVPSQHRLVDRGNATQRLFKVANGFAEAAQLPFALAIGCDLYVVSMPYWGALISACMGGGAAAIALGFWYGLGSGLRTILTRQEKDKPMPPESQTDLHEKINQMLTEARVILPGAQAMLGFQFVVTMTRSFAQMPALEREVHFFSLAAVALSTILLITPAAVHRITFGGNDLPRMHTIGSVLVTLALLPLALGLSGDFYVAMTKMVPGTTLAAASAAMVMLVLVVLWYAVPFALRGYGTNLRRGHA